jgi:hypothetical protein
MPLVPRSNIKRTLLVFGILILLIGASYGLSNLKAKHDLEKFKREWEARGEKFDFKSFVPPPVPDEQNFALTPIVATSYEWMLDKNGHELKPHRTNYVERIRMETDAPNEIEVNYLYTNQNLHLGGNWAEDQTTDLKDWQQYYRAMSAITNLFAVPPQPRSPAADVLMALSKYDSTIEELRNASRLTNSRFPLNYDAKPYQVYLMHLSYLRRGSETLQLRASAELANGQSQNALEDIKLSLRLMDSTRSEPFLITHLTRVRMVNSVIQPIWEGLINHEWSDAQLAELDKQLSELDFLSDYAFSMRSERANLLAGIEQIRRHRYYLLNYSDMPYSARNNFKPLPWIIFYLAPSSIYYRVELDYLKQYPNWVLPMVNVEQRIVVPSLSTNYGIAMDEFEKYRSPHNFVSMFMGAVGYPARKFTFAQSSTDLARTACALERYYLIHGEFPETLNTLAPQFIAQVPHDIIGGQPLRYRRTSDGKFLLYSVGWNEKDDGGVIVHQEHFSSVDDSKSDWVWKN